MISNDTRKHDSLFPQLVPLKCHNLGIVQKSLHFELPIKNFALTL